MARIRSGLWLAVALSCGAVLAGPAARGAPQQDPTLVPVGLVGGAPRAVAVWGTRAYVAAGWTIQIVDAADLAHPIAIGQIPLDQTALDLAVTRSGLLLVALGPGGLVAFDLADPAAPKPAGTLAATAYVRLVAADGDTAYVIDGTAGTSVLRVVDAARGAQPGEVERVAVDPGTFAVAGADGYAFVASDRTLDNFVAFDARAPGLPRKLGSVTVQQCSGCPSVLEAAGRTVVALGYSGLVVLESTGDGLRRVGSVAVPEPTSTTDLVLRDGFAYLLCGAGVCAFDLANPAQPRYAGASAPPISAALLASAGAGPFVGVRPAALTTIDVTGPASPTLGAELPLLGGVSGPVAGTSDPAVLLAGIDDRLAVLDATNPAAPTLAGLLDLELGSQNDQLLRQIDVHGDVALLTTSSFYDGAVVTVDVSEPRHPRRLGVARTMGIPSGLASDGRVAYVTEGFEGPPRPDITEVFDIADPATPRHVATLPKAEGALHMIAGSLVAAGLGGVHVFDITAPEAPALVAHFPLSVRSSLAEGDLLFVTTSREIPPRLVVLDMSEPRHPMHVGEVFGSFPSLRTTVGGLLVLSGNGVWVVDVTNPAAPRSAANPVWGAGSLDSLNGVGGRLFAASRDVGLWVLEPRVGGPLPSATPPNPTLTPLPTPTLPTLRAFLPLVRR